MKYDEYQKYICNDYFVDYISVPERFSCDNTDILINELGKKIKIQMLKYFYMESVFQKWLWHINLKTIKMPYL